MVIKKRGRKGRGEKKKASVCLPRKRKGEDPNCVIRKKVGQGSVHAIGQKKKKGGKETDDYQKRKSTQNEKTTSISSNDKKKEKEKKVGGGVYDFPFSFRKKKGQDEGNPGKRGQMVTFFIQNLRKRKGKGENEGRPSLPGNGRKGGGAMAVNSERMGTLLSSLVKRKGRGEKKKKKK